MTRERKRIIIKSVWSELLGVPFDIRKLAERILHDGGVDAAQVGVDDIKDLFDGKFNNAWGEIAFAFDEMLCCYLDRNISNEEFVTGIFISLYLSEAIGEGHGDWEFSFDKILEMLCQNKEKVGFDFRMRFLAEILIRDVGPREHEGSVASS